MSKITKFRQRFATFKLQLISHNIHTFPELLIYLSCFIFCYKVIEYQPFRKMKHTTLMFSLKKELGIAKVICKPPVLVPKTAQKSYLSKLGEMAHV